MERFRSIVSEYVKQSLHYEETLNTLPVIDVQQHLLFNGGRLALYGVTKAATSWSSKTVFLFRLTLLFIFALRWTLIAFVKDKQLLLYLGDFTLYVPGTKEYLIMAYVFWSVQAVLVGVQAYMWNDRVNDRFAWLRPFLLCTRELTSADIKLSPRDAVKFWFHTSLAKVGIKMSTYSAQLLETVQYFYVCIFLMDRQTLYKYFIHQAVLYLIWHYYVCYVLLTLILLFHTYCYYIGLRFNNVSENTCSLLKDNESYTLRQRSTRVLSIIKEHNEICSLLEAANAYWQLTMSLIYIFYILIVCTWMYLLTYEDIDLGIKANVFVLVVFNFLGLTFFSLSAAWCSARGVEFDKLLQKLLQLKMTSVTRLKVAFYLKRRFQGQKLGFKPFTVCIITYTTYYEAIVALVSYYLLAVEFAVKKRNMLAE